MRQTLEDPESLNFELLFQIMDEKEYDRTIRYKDPEYIDLEEAEARRNGIQELHAFFASPDCSLQQKKAIEKTIIFGLFLQAKYDFYQALEEYIEKSLDKNFNYNKPGWAIKRPFLNYHWFLDHLSYKCNPTAYKTFSGLSYAALWLALSSFIIIPIAWTFLCFSHNRFFILCFHDVRRNS